MMFPVAHRDEVEAGEGLQGKPQPSERGIEHADHFPARHAKQRKSLFLKRLIFALSPSPALTS
jgi:hypothetical protein